MSIAAEPISALPIAAETAATKPTKTPPPKRQATAVADVVQQPEAR